MIRISALTSGRSDPASRFRVRQYIEPLKLRGIEVREYIPPINKYAPLPLGSERIRTSPFILPLSFIWQGIKLTSRIPDIFTSRKGDITWLQRDLAPGCPTFEFLLKEPVALDVDDAIWLHPPFGKQSLIAAAKRAGVVLAGNSYIAAYVEPYARSLFVVPTAVDTEKFMPEPYPPCEKTGRFTIGWMGTASNLKYLLMIEGPLTEFMKRHPDAELLIVSDDMPRFRKFSSERLRFMPWSEECEAAALGHMDVGIMPLPDSEWTRGKCSYKMLLYMACGMPVVVSPVGMNIEVLGKGAAGLAARGDAEWYEAFSFLYKNRASALAFGAAGRKTVEEYYSRELISERLADIFESLR